MVHSSLLVEFSFLAVTETTPHTIAPRISVSEPLSRFLLSVPWCELSMTVCRRRTAIGLFWKIKTISSAKLSRSTQSSFHNCSSVFGPFPLLLFDFIFFFLFFFFFSYSFSWYYFLSLFSFLVPNHLTPLSGKSIRSRIDNVTLKQTNEGQRIASDQVLGFFIMNTI